MEPEIQVDWWKLIPYKGDRLLLCSDGLTNELSDDRIAATLRQIADPHEAARDLVRQARAEGGGDNITVVVVDVLDDDGRAEQASEVLAQDHALAGSPRKNSTVDLRAGAKPAADLRAGGLGAGAGGAVGAAADPTQEDVTGLIHRDTLPPVSRNRSPLSSTLDSFNRLPAGPPAAKPKRFTWRVVGFTVVLIGVILGTVAAIGWYARSTYYVGFAGDQVAIYKGRPGGVLWFKPTLRERKPLTRAEVPLAFLPALEKGKEVGSKAEADRYVTNLRDKHLEEERAGTEGSTTTTIPSASSPGPEPPP
jgi:hypothetical protein